MSESTPHRRARDPWLDGRPPHLPAARHDVPAVCLLPGDPARVSLAGRVLDGFGLVGQSREFTFGVGYQHAVPIGVCSTGIGGPSAEIAVVELARLGASTVIRVGGMGALRPDLTPGTVCAVTRAVAWGGTARLYAPPGDDRPADPDVLASLRQQAAHLDVPLAEVSVVSTDAYYVGQGRPLPAPAATAGLAERSAAQWAALDALHHVDAVDMETETVLAVGHALGLRAGALLVAHGNRATDAWLEDYEPAQLTMLRLAAHAARALSSRD